MLCKLYELYAVIFGYPVFRKFNRFLFELALRGLGIYNSKNMSLSGERWLIKNVVSRIGTELIVFDVGANVGTYTREILDSVPTIKEIYAFEPHPATYQRLAANVAGDEKVKTYQCALGAKLGAMKLYDYEVSHGEGTSHASLSGDVFKEIHGAESVSVSVNVDTIDAVMGRLSIEKIDFLKIDVEGFEFDVFVGAERALKEGRIACIQFEFTQLNAATRVFFKDYYDLLESQYRIYRLLPHGLLELHGYHPTAYEIFGYQNYLAIQKGLW